MACYRPMYAWRARERSPSGKRAVVFSSHGAYSDMQLEIPCGQCIGCRIDRARSWALRIVHESKMHDENCFVTLTYAPEHVPPGLVVRDLQLFFKRLRNESGRKFRYFAVGEYGEKLSRPHYHCLLFGFDFPDKKFWKGKGEYRQYRSAMLEKAWPLGHALSGSLTPASAQYCAKYSVKKVRGSLAEAHYGTKTPEFAVMSRRPGIGAAWFDKYHASVFPRDFVVVPGGRKVAVPRYYLDRLRDEATRRDVRAQRRVNSRDPARVAEQEWYRLVDRERYAEAVESHFNERRVSDEAASLRGTG